MKSNAALRGARRRPSLIAFAPRERLMSIHEDDCVLDARVATLARTFLPWSVFPGPRNYHSFDVVISGGNPLLAAILLWRAVRNGLSAAVTLPGAPDPWPYDLAMSTAGGRMILSAMEVSAQDVDSRFPVAQSVLRAMLKASAGSACLLPGHELIASVKHPPEEIALYLSDRRETVALPPEQESLASEFRLAAADFDEACCLPGYRTAVFASRLILTSMPRTFTSTSLSASDGLVRIDWDHPMVTATGTARTDTSDGESAARTMIEDVLSCARGYPLLGLRPQ